MLLYHKLGKMADSMLAFMVIVLVYLFVAPIATLMFTECRRKRAIGTVTVRMPGTGKVQINNQDIHYFEGIQQREQVR